MGIEERVEDKVAQFKVGDKINCFDINDGIEVEGEIIEITDRLARVKTEWGIVRTSLTTARLLS